MSDWISVKDRLPEIGERVLIAYKRDSYNDKGISYATYYKGIWNSPNDSIVGCNFYNYNCEVTHWKHDIITYPDEYYE
jgi:hypothetical protein